jgi:hypothetical protein
MMPTTRHGVSYEGKITMKRSLRLTIGATIAVALTVAVATPASAVVSDPRFVPGRGAAPSAVYNVSFNGGIYPVYENSIPSRPAKAWVGIRNAYGTSRMIVQEYTGQNGGTATCVAAGGTIWTDSSLARAWVALSGPYPCTPGEFLRIT